MWNKQEKTEMPIELMSYDQLLVLKMRVDQELTSRGDSELHALKEKLELIANAQGVSIGELFGVRVPRQKKERKKREVRIKYRNPDNPEESWTGVGKMKKWLAEKIEAGHALEEFAVT